MRTARTSCIRSTPWDSAHLSGKCSLPTCCRLGPTQTSIWPMLLIACETRRVRQAPGDQVTFIVGWQSSSALFRRPDERFLKQHGHCTATLATTPLPWRRQPHCSSCNRHRPIELHFGDGCKPAQRADSWWRRQAVLQSMTRIEQACLAQLHRHASLIQPQSLSIRVSMAIARVLFPSQRHEQVAMQQMRH